MATTLPRRAVRATTHRSVASGTVPTAPREAVDRSAPLAPEAPVDERDFEVSVDTRASGRRLGGYTRRTVDGHELLLDPGLLKLPIALVITTGGIDGPCPIQLL